MLAAFRLLARLPLSWLQAAGAGLGRLVWLLSGEFRAKTRQNLRQAARFDAALADPTLARRSAAQAGRMVGELPWVWFSRPEALRARVICDDLAVLAQVEAAGRGILFLTPHLGAFEVTARWYAARAPITVLFKPPKRSVLSRVLAVARDTPGMRAAPASLAGLRTLLRALRNGEAVGLLPDQVPTDGEGRWAPLFGAPAFTMTLPEKLVVLTGASVVLAVGERLPAGAGWRVHLRRMHERPTPELLNREMEGLVLTLPDQYLWGYNRYKGDPPGPAAGVAAP